MIKRTLLTLLTSIIILLLVSILFLWFKPLPTFNHDPVRHLPWQVPDASKAEYKVKVLDDGRIQIEIEHLPLVGIEPKMIAWFYRVLPISRVTLNDKAYPLYHIFHPSEHGQIEVKEQASDGTQGMGINALVERQEWFGKYNSKGAGRITHFSNRKMVIKPEILGFQFGNIEHRFNKTADGTQYTLVSEIGVKNSVLGAFLNYYLREKIFTKNMIEEWVRHQVEEVGSLQFFLPQLYNSPVKENHFSLTINDNRV